MVRFPPCVDMTHLRACPLVGRLRVREDWPRRGREVRPCDGP